MNQNKVKSERGKFIVEREFNAPVEKVYAAWTMPEHFGKWFGPKGAEVAELQMDFRVGGTTLYCLKMGNGFEYWGKFIYTEIVANQKLAFLNSVTDAEGNPIKMPRMENWPLELLTTITFEDKGGKTLLSLTAEPHKATEAETQGFEQGKDSMDKGWAGSFEVLEEHLS